MGLLDIMRAAVAPAAAARGAYLTGQMQGESRRRQQAQEDEAMQLRRDAAQRQQESDRRQSLIDQIRLERERKALAEGPPDQWDEVDGVDEPSVFNRRTGEVRKLDGVTRPKKATEPPKSRTTDRGIEEWDAVNGVWRVTGRKPYRVTDEKGPRRNDPNDPDTPAGRTKTLRDQIRENIQAKRGQVDDTETRIREMEQGVGEIDEGELGRLKTRRDSVTRVVDSLNVELDRNTTGAKAKPAISADQARFLRQRKGWTDQQINARYTVLP